MVDNANTASPTLYYVHTDHLGRPARMVAENWAWVWDVIYSPFGGTSYLWDNTAKLDARFPGQWFQLESGLAYNWHHHYDATLGRYVQPDPIGYEGGLKQLFLLAVEMRRMFGRQVSNSRAKPSSRSLEWPLSGMKEL